MKPLPPPQDIGHDANTILASNRTGLSFERTRMSADRTLMGIVRTSLSLIGFGFTIHTVFDKLAQSGSVPLNEHSARNFGLALIFIGVVMLILGIGGHLKFQGQLTQRHEHLFQEKLLGHSVQYRATPTFVVAAALLFVGLAAFAVITFNALN